MSATPEWLAADVAEVLELDAAAIGAGDDLLDHGMDSIRLMTLAETWRQRGLDVDLADLLERPTLAGWARLFAP
ncbi:phosphopantetheine-binding protein [Actinokineospora pegani]|uniref:phosphopantetheine-binding protein n=1 Tax=Actinokineospora pegani TaxID=2654637 RepID=UPI0012E9B370|nr:phosphopantetheine-binding protein [Actinokineospora pegani]